MIKADATRLDESAATVRFSVKEADNVRVKGRQFLRGGVFKIRARGLMLAAIEVPLAAFVAGTGNAQSPQQSERLEALIRAQATQIDQLRLEMKALKKAQSKTSQRAQSNTPQPAPTDLWPADKPLTSPCSLSPRRTETNFG